jgi:site-specific recombinase XerD
VALLKWGRRSRFGQLVRRYDAISQAELQPLGLATVALLASVTVTDGEPVFGPVKDTKNRPRTIPLADVVMVELVEHVRRYGHGPSGVLFTTDEECPLGRNDFGRVWRSAARPLGIPAGDGFHQRRHYFASLLIGGGASITLVQDLLGHAGLSTTQIYAHLFPESADQARAAVDRVLGPVSSACPEAAPQTV